MDRPLVLAWSRVCTSSISNLGAWGAEESADGLEQHRSGTCSKTYDNVDVAEGSPRRLGIRVGGVGGGVR